MGLLWTDRTTQRKLPSLSKSLLEKILVCKGKADKLAMRDPRNVKELKDRIVWERLKKILTHRYGRYTD